MDINDRYKAITGNDYVIKTINPVAHIPKPTDTDYKKGYVTRYFCQKINDPNSPIYEINDSDYASLSSQPLYNTTSLRWRITGSLTPTKIGAGMVADMGVLESNKASIKLASSLITKLSLYLPNLQQFYRKI